MVEQGSGRASASRCCPCPGGGVGPGAGGPGRETAIGSCHRAPRLSCRWKRVTMSRTGSTILRQRGSAQARDHVRVADVQAEAHRRGVDPLRQRAERQWVRRDRLRAREDRREVLQGDADAEPFGDEREPGERARLERASCPPPGGRPAARGRGRRRARRRIRRRRRARPRGPGRRPARRASRSAGACSTARSSVDSSAPRTARAWRMQLRESARTAAGGDGNWTQPKPEASISFSSGCAGHHSLGTLSPSLAGML